MFKDNNVAIWRPEMIWDEDLKGAIGQEPVKYLISCKK